jgi:hypothetical protein
MGISLSIWSINHDTFHVIEDAIIEYVFVFCFDLKLYKQVLYIPCFILHLYFCLVHVYVILLNILYVYNSININIFF